ncbi:hypothetical protein P3X46_023651 [Hevea brasiliensis]|uniref:Alcohol dehydrogenase N-terminal domain-containing protein n=1 Tax=Hevea brasiliensis TaxID=3981 RepID=A0ABQ9LDG9_HEVBR|nr:hypothetical protein P3X46_023651 [Hevea brasiliensis]
MEAVGEGVAVGPGLTGRKAGDIVVYAGISMDSFTEEQILLANKVVPVPSSISPVIAASVMTKGMTAQFLVRRCFKGSLACLKTRGYTVSFGRSSGTPDPLPLSGLAPKALFLTRPSLMFYTETREELLETAAEVFANIVSGVLRVRVNHTYPLSEAAQAHAELRVKKHLGHCIDTVKQMYSYQLY